VVAAYYSDTTDPHCLRRLVYSQPAHHVRRSSQHFIGFQFIRGARVDAAPRYLDNLSVCAGCVCNALQCLMRLAYSAVDQDIYWSVAQICCALHQNMCRLFFLPTIW